MVSHLPFFSVNPESTREALNNAAQHGRPRSVRISIGVTDGALRLNVAADGRGLEATPTLDRKPGNGLRIMQLRAELIGGKIKLRPNGDHGCVVTCVVPQGFGGTAEAPKEA